MLISLMRVCYLGKYSIVLAARSFFRTLQVQVILRPTLIEIHVKRMRSQSGHHVEEHFF